MIDSIQLKHTKNGLTAETGTSVASCSHSPASLACLLPSLRSSLPATSLPPLPCLPPPQIPRVISDTLSMHSLHTYTHSLSGDHGREREGMAKTEEQANQLPVRRVSLVPHATREIERKGVRDQVSYPYHHHHHHHPRRHDVVRLFPDASVADHFLMLHAVTVLSSKRWALVCLRRSPHLSSHLLSLYFPSNPLIHFLGISVTRCTMSPQADCHTYSVQVL